MNYKINYTLYGGVFAVPCCVADEHLKLAGGLAVKALLWMLRHCGEPLSPDAIAAALGQPRGEIIDALRFWLERGVLLSGDEEVTESPAARISISPNASAAPEPPAMPRLPASPRPNDAQIAARLEESDELAWLFGEAQKRLGRTIGYDGRSTLLMLHDTYGLSSEVIPMLLHYCVEAGKLSYAYIEKVGRDWAEKEIDSIEKADEQITALSRDLALWRELQGMAGLHAPRPTAAQREYLQRWVKEYGFGMEMIFPAYEEMANHTGKLSFAYMDKVLQSWRKAGLKTPEEVAAFKTAKPKQKRAESKTSYDLDEYERSTLTVPVL
ncbi:MAG: DnaD domain protein [Oscillospiraceae bacterium]|nr:DnaD domain protein [Oscillospiraceae bacterium]